MSPALATSCPAAPSASDSHERITAEMPSFVTQSSATLEVRAQLAMQSAERTFPLLGELLKRLGNTLPEVKPIESFALGSGDGDAALKLKALFDGYGSDKSTTHDYHLFYGQILSPPHEVRSILEIGLGTNYEDVPSTMGPSGRPGASLRAFRDYCSNAVVYGADIDRRILFEEERITTFFVDQTDPASMQVLSSQLPDEIDLIIDDGLHSPDANLATAILATGKLKVGGWMVIEDISKKALPIWQMVSYLLEKDFRVSLLEERPALVLVAQRRRPNAC